MNTQLQDSLLIKYLDPKFDAIDQRFDAIDQKFESDDIRFEAIAIRLEDYNNKLGTSVSKHQETLENYVRSNDNVSIAQSAQTFMSYFALVISIFLGLALWYRGRINNYFKDIWKKLH